MRVAFILWLREVKKYFRSPAQMIGSLGSPIMYLGILGFGLGPIFQRELLTLPRRTRHYVTRTVYLGLVWILVFSRVLLARRSPSTTPQAPEPPAAAAPAP